MKRVTLAIFALASTLLLLNPTVAFFSKTISDEEGDIDGDQSNKDVDIKKATYIQNDDGGVSLTLQVYGKINADCMYTIVLMTNTSNKNATVYMIGYSENAFVKELFNTTKDQFVIVSREDGTEDYVDADFYISDDTLRASFNLESPDEEFYGIYVTTLYMEFWGDITGDVNETTYAADELMFLVEEESNNTSGGTGNGDTTPSDGQSDQQQSGGEKSESPGFEIVVMIAALLTILVISRKRRDHR